MKWFDQWKWIHYDEAADSVFCHVCAKVEEEGILKSTSKDLAFIKEGYTNWKDVTESFVDMKRVIATKKQFRLH